MYILSYVPIDTLTKKKMREKNEKYEWRKEGEF